MSEMLQGDVQGTNVEPAQVTAPAVDATTAPSPEKVFKQSEVNAIVKRERRDTEERLKQKQAQEYVPPPVQESASNSQNPNSFDEDAINRKIAEGVQRSWNEQLEHVQRLREEQDAKRIAADFFQRLEAGKAKYQDYDGKVGKLNFQSMPQIVSLASAVDNTAEVMYELANNPSKIANLLVLANIPNTNGELALMEMQRLSQSIKDNQEATNHRSPREPLSQLKPTNTGTDTRNLSVSDYRRRPWARV